MNLRWSKRALKDVKQLRDYIALDSPFYAQQFIGRMGARIETLPDFPHSGRLVPEAEREDIRELIFQGYRLIYRVSEHVEEVVMVTVVHSTRDLTNSRHQTWDSN